MKKMLLLLWIPFIVSSCSLCDAWCEQDYVIENNTRSDIFIEFENARENIVVKAGETKTVAESGGHCSCKQKSPLPDLYPDENMIMTPFFSNFEVRVGDDVLSHDIWRRKYCTYTSTTSKRTYLLVVTDELLEEIRE